jgi:uncharacterized membrane protein
MNGVRQRRAWLLVAAIAIMAAVLLLMAASAHSDHAAAWLAILPALYVVGVISPLSLLSPLAYMYVGRVPDAPCRPSLFERPPPPSFRLG